MFISSLVLTAAAASKWLIAAKVATAVGGCCITIDRAVKEIKRERER